MLEHHTRVILITLMLAVSIIGLVVMSSLGQTEGTVFGALIGLASLLGPAFLDALGVQRRGTLRTTHQLEDAVRRAEEDAAAVADEEELLENRR